MKRHFLNVFLTGSLWLGVNELAAAPGTYTVGKGETLFGIARKLGVGVGRLYELNPGLKENPSVKIGQQLQVPDAADAPRPAATEVVEDAAYPQAEEFRTYTVQPKETAYGIARQFGVSYEVLKKYNPEMEAGLKVGMKLRIPMAARPASEAKPVDVKPLVASPSSTSKPVPAAESPAMAKPAPAAVKPASEFKPAAPPSRPLTTQAAASSMPEPDLSKFSGRELDYKNQFMRDLENGKKISKEKGSAVFLEDEENGNPYLALCDLVPVGSVVQLRNLLNGRTAFVKVLGKLPQEDKIREVSIKIPSGLRTVLKTSDSLILVELSLLK